MEIYIGTLLPGVEQSERLYVGKMTTVIDSKHDGDELDVNYWRERCLAAERYFTLEQDWRRRRMDECSPVTNLEECPICTPSFRARQVWQELVKRGEG